MEFRLLGPLEVAGDGGALGIAAHKPRALLAYLLLHANEVVPAERLIDELWDVPPPSAPKVLQTYISQLRKELGAGRIVTRSPGYCVRVDPGELDVDRFDLVRSERPHDALALWRGPPLVDFEHEAWAQPEIARLEEARLETLEARIERELERGEQRNLVVELEPLVRMHPLRERFRAQLMLALYRAGRQADALAVYREGRRLLADELGLEPTPSLQRLERSILRQDPSLDAAPARAPADREGLIGRETALADVAELLRTSRLTTLTGPGGIGKTRLAYEAANRSAPAFADGSTIVELAAINDAGLVLSEIARVLGVRQATIDALADWLGRKELLLVLDNFEQVAAAAPLLDELLDRTPTLSLLVTSRVALHLSRETLYAVAPLELPETRTLPPVEALAATGSVTLFVARARATLPDFELGVDNAADVAELCVRLDGLPLALELAGARANLLSPAAIVARLGRRLDVLRASGAASDRHRSLRAAIEWSYELLSPQEQLLFTTLAVFSGGFTIDAAEAVMRGDVLDGIPALVNSSLVRAERPVGDEPRFGLLETIREYALERLAERDDSDEIRHRHAAFYAALAEQAERELRARDQIRWLRRIDAERDNVRSAISWATESGNVELGLRVATGLWRYWQIRAQVPEGRAHVERLLALADNALPARARADAAGAAGRLAFMQADFDAAVEWTEASLAESELPLHAMSLSVLAMAEYGRGRASHADELLERAAQAARANTDWFAYALVLHGRGHIAYAAGRFDDARRAFDEAVRAATEAGDLRNAAVTLSSLGAVALEQEAYGRARDVFSRALELHRELGDQWAIARALVGLGIVALAEGSVHDAQALLEQGLALQLDADDRPGIAATLERIAVLAARLGAYEAAVSLHGAAAILREMIGSHPMHLVHHGADDAVAAVADALGADAFAEAWARGRAMTLTEASAFALDTMRRYEHVRSTVS